MKANKVVISVIILIFLITQSAISVSAAAYSAPIITLNERTISWEAVDVQYGVSAPTVYYIYCNGSDGSSANHVMVAGQSMRWTIDTRYLNYDVTYSIYVKAANGNIISPASNTVQFMFHSYDQNWRKDNSNHWLQCIGCGYKQNNTAHDFDNSCDTTCGVCLYTRTIYHSPSSDDGNCTTPIKCSVCSTITTPGKSYHSFTNDCDTTCDNKGCTHVRTASHNYTKLEKNATEHWYVCSQCGVEQPNSRSTHSGGNSNCQVKANCATCGQTYGSFGDHHYDTNKYGYQDTAGHAHKCLYCNDHDTLIPHSPNISVATENTAKYCTTTGCGYIIQQKLDHVHQESTAWEYDSMYHWHDCIANDGREYRKGTHTYDNSCDTSCNGGCGYSRTITHNYTKLQRNATEHWYVCSVCDVEKPNSRISHSGGKASCVALAICSTCQHEYGTFAQHPYGTTWEFKTANGHAHVCTTTNCNEHDEITPHTPNIPAATEQQAKVCTACGYQMAAQLNHSHNPASDWSYNATHHWNVCSGCTAHLNETTHIFENDCDTICNCGYTRAAPHRYSKLEKGTAEHWYICSVCNAEKPNSRASHIGGIATCTSLAVCSICQCEYGTLTQHPYGTIWEYKTATGHAHICTTPNCTKHDEITSHTPNIPAATEQQAQICTACGYQLSAPLNHSHSPATEWNYNATHHWNACGGCAAQLNEGTHEPGAEATTTTAQTCTICGYEIAPALGNEEIQVPTDSTDATTPTNSTESTDATTPTVPTDKTDPEDGSFPSWIVIVVVIGGVVIVVAIKKKRFAHKRN